MRRKIYRIFSVLLCLQLLFGLVPVELNPEHDDHDHDHGFGLVTPVSAWDVESECVFCGGFIADEYICDCGVGGDHCSAESGRDCYEANHCQGCGEGVGEENICACGEGCEN